jgi:hypothetical protein
MTTVLHTWITRVYCPSCDSYSWTTPGSPSVLCACMASEIADDVIVRGEEVVDTTAFKQAVADELNVDIDDLGLRTI